MRLGQAVQRVAGSAPIRAAVNQGFHAFSRRRVAQIDHLDPVATQRLTLRRLIRTAQGTRFGRDHRFQSIRTVEEFQARVPLRTYEALWTDYLGAFYPVWDDLCWPGRIPYHALTSGTTQGATKFIPVSRAMIASNQKAAKTMVAAHLANRPGSRLFRGRLFFLGGSTDLQRPAPGVRQGDLSGIAAQEAADWLRPYAFPPLELALETDWDRKLDALSRQGVREPITLVGGVPSWLLTLFDRIRDQTGKATIAEVWPELELVVHGGVKFDPYRRAFAEALGDPTIRLQETYPCSEGFIAFGDPQTGLLRLVVDHGLFFEFVPVAELDALRPTRHWLGTVEPGVNYAIVVSTCAGLWSHVIGDTVRFESVRPPLIHFTGRTRYTLSAFGEHLISEEVEAAIASASFACGASVRDWHLGPVFAGPAGHHHLVVEFLEHPADLGAFRRAVDADLQQRNADYQAHRVPGVGLPLLRLTVANPGGFDGWMRQRGKLGGQHKVPRMDGSGDLTRNLADTLARLGLVQSELPAGD